MIVLPIVRVLIRRNRHASESRYPWKPGKVRGPKEKGLPLKGGPTGDCLEERRKVPGLLYLRRVLKTPMDWKMSSGVLISWSGPLENTPTESVQTFRE